MRSLAVNPASSGNSLPPAKSGRTVHDTVASTADERGTAQRNRVILFATVTSFVWLAAAAAAIYLVVRYLPPSQFTLTALAGLAAGVTAPLTAIWLVALVFARVAPGGALAVLRRIEVAEARFSDVAGRTRRELEAIDAALDVVSGRMDDVRTQVSVQTGALLDGAGELETKTAAVTASLARDRDTVDTLIARLSSGSSAARGELLALIETLPAAERQALAIQSLLAAGADTAREQIAQVDGLLTAVAANQESLRRQANRTAAELHDTFAAVDAGSSAAARLFDERTRTLGADVDAAMSRAAEALEAARRAIEAQVDAVVTATGQARTILVDLGGETAASVSERLSAIAGEAERLTSEIGRQETLSAGLVESFGRGFGVLDAKLANAAQSSHATFDMLDERLGAIRDQVHKLATPLGATSEHTRQLEAAVTALKESVAASVTSFTETLPDSVANAGGAVADIRAAIGTLSAEIDSVLARANAVAAPIDAGRTTIAAAAESLADQRTAFEAMMTTLDARLTSAQKLVGQIESGTDAAALAATTKLLEALTRARDVASQAEGALREALDRAIADTKVTLAAASDEAMRTAFTAPVAAQLAELGAVSTAGAEAGRAAAERLSQQLFSVLETANLVETRLGEADARIETASRRDLSRRGALLIDALNSASIDIAKALAVDVSDTAWAAYLRGDRSIFTRRSVRLLDGGTAKAIVRQYERDGEFRDSVRRYINDFEQLMKSVAAEREGNSLQVALLASDTGRLYVALAQAMERIRT